jgi:peroxiredoxin
LHFVSEFTPDLQLLDAKGQSVSLTALNANGPLIIVFYRGGWCPYCNLELREWQRLLPEVQKAGAQLVAISPQTPDKSLSTAEKNELAFTVLSDSQLTATKEFGLGFQLPPDLVELYKKFGNDLPTINGNAEWALPLPATYLIGRDGLVKFAHVDVDYRKRAEPSEILAMIA